jgi:putative transposase
MRERRDQLRHPSCARPELIAAGPGAPRTWDITKLLGPKNWRRLHLDVFKRDVFGWMVGAG